MVLPQPGNCCRQFLLHLCAFLPRLLQDAGLVLSVVLPGSVLPNPTCCASSCCWHRVLEGGVGLLPGVCFPLANPLPQGGDQCNVWYPVRYPHQCSAVDKSEGLCLFVQYALLLDMVRALHPDSR